MHQCTCNYIHTYTEKRCKYTTFITYFTFVVCSGAYSSTHTRLVWSPLHVHTYWTYTSCSFIFHSIEIHKHTCVNVCIRKKSPCVVHKSEAKWHAILYQVLFCSRYLIAEVVSGVETWVIVLSIVIPSLVCLVLTIASIVFVYMQKSYRMRKNGYPITPGNNALLIYLFTSSFCVHKYLNSLYNFHFVSIAAAAVAKKFPKSPGE